MSFITLLLTVCFAACGISKCYSCSSTKSLDDCNKHQEETSCPAHTESCIMLSVQYKADDGEKKSFKKACATKEECENPDSTEWKRCFNNAGKSCTFQCCQEADLCNRGHSVPLVSTLLMFACALVTFFR